MASISTHLHPKRYQVANTTDRALPHRKWNHLGTHYAVDHKQAAYDVYKGEGTIVGESTGAHGIVYHFSCGLFVSVGF